MPLREELRAQGDWLFRFRSYLPLVAFLLLIPVGVEVYTGRYEYRTCWWWQTGCVLIALLGMLVRVVTVGFSAPGTSGRNTRGQRAADLNTTGPYATVRHPLYFGNFLIFLALLLFTGAWWLALSGTLAYWLYYERIMFAEEEFLRDTYGERFVTWASATSAAFPRPWRWRRPERRFSVRKAVLGEYPTAFGTVTSFALFDTVLRTIQAWQFSYSRAWLAAFGAVLVLYLAVRALHKLTRVLNGQ